MKDSSRSSSRGSRSTHAPWYQSSHGPSQAIIQVWLSPLRHRQYTPSSSDPISSSTMSSSGGGEEPRADVAPAAVDLRRGALLEAGAFLVGFFAVPFLFAAVAFGAERRLGPMAESEGTGEESEVF